MGLEAVHSRWHAYDGLDEASNGPALCTLHDRVFDLGINLLMHGPKSDFQPVVSRFRGDAHPRPGGMMSKGLIHGACVGVGNRCTKAEPHHPGCVGMGMVGRHNFLAPWAESEAA